MRLMPRICRGLNPVLICLAATGGLGRSGWAAGADPGKPPVTRRARAVQTQARSERVRRLLETNGSALIRQRSQEALRAGIERNRLQDALDLARREYAASTREIEDLESQLRASESRYLRARDRVMAQPSAIQDRARRQAYGDRVAAREEAAVAHAGRVQARAEGAAQAPLPSGLRGATPMMTEAQMHARMRYRAAQFEKRYDQHELNRSSDWRIAEEQVSAAERRVAQAKRDLGVAVKAHDQHPSQATEATVNQARNAWASAMDELDAAEARASFAQRRLENAYHQREIRVPARVRSASLEAARNRYPRPPQATETVESALVDRAAQVQAATTEGESAIGRSAARPGQNEGSMERTAAIPASRLRSGARGAAIATTLALAAREVYDLLGKPELPFQRHDEPRSAKSSAQSGR
jgi:hypothetical protein